MNRAARRVSTAVLQLSLRWRIGTLVIAGLVIILSFFGILGAEIAQDGRERTISEWVNLTNSTAGFIDSELQVQFDRLDLLASRLDGNVDDTARRATVLTDTATRQSTFVVGAFVVGADSAVRWSDSTLAGVLKASDAGEPNWSDALQGRHYASGALAMDGRAVVVLAVPVRRGDGQVVGVLGTVIRPDLWVVDDLVGSARGIAKTGHAELLDQHDRVIVSSEAGHVLGLGEHPEFYEPLLTNHAMDVGLTAPVGGDEEGQRHVMAFVPLKNAPWGLALGGANAELSADADRWQTQIALFGGLTLLVTLFVLWIAGRRTVFRRTR